jgi:alkylhydroperoxidase family enzyme
VIIGHKPAGRNQDPRRPAPPVEESLRYTSTHLFRIRAQENAMPHIQPLTDQQASPEARALFDQIQSAFKMVPNIFRTMGHAPAVVQATLALTHAIQGDLDPKLRELAYLKTSQLNHCHY